jgi:hypothetical protein
VPVERAGHEVASSLDAMAVLHPAGHPLRAVREIPMILFFYLNDCYRLTDNY